MCGIIGLYTINREAVMDIYDGMMVLQHRGQDAAGIATCSDKLRIRKGSGLVTAIFDAQNLAELKGSIGIGHTRYPTRGTGAGYDAQPFVTDGIAMAHNGNVTNVEELKDEIEQDPRRRVSSGCDVEVILHVFARAFEQSKGEDAKRVKHAVQEVFKQVRGAYSVVALIQGKGLIAFRDPRGIRPLAMGRKKRNSRYEYSFASESAAFNLIEHEQMDDVGPGEVIFINTEGKIHRSIIEQKQHTPCIFEYVYFARPDTVMDHINVYKTRLRIGKELSLLWKGLSEKKGVKADVIIPVPDSSRPAAMAMAAKLRLRYREGLIKNRYVARTFIMAGQRLRESSIRYKLTPLRQEIEGKNVLLVDDSIVRGTTSKQIVELVRKAGAKKVFFASGCPPIMYPCFYGIDMTTRKELIAAQKSIDDIRKHIGADELIYMTIPALKRAAGTGNENIKEFCSACMDGNYPTGDITEEVHKRLGSERIISKRRAGHDI